MEVIGELYPLKTLATKLAPVVTSIINVSIDERHVPILSIKPLFNKQGFDREILLEAQSDVLSAYRVILIMPDLA